MKPIATDTYNFERLMTDGYTYVDKTAVLVIAPKNLKKWAVAGNVWSCMFNRQFIVRNEFRFLNLKHADDASFLYSALIKAKRIYFHPVAYLHYRRGQGTSIVDLHGKNYES